MAAYIMSPRHFSGMRAPRPGRRRRFRFPVKAGKYLLWTWVARHARRPGLLSQVTEQVLRWAAR
jgi:hypothetical protein